MEIVDAVIRTRPISTTGFALKHMRLWLAGAKTSLVGRQNRVCELRRREPEKKRDIVSGEAGSRSPGISVAKNRYCSEVQYREEDQVLFNPLYQDIFHFYLLICKQKSKNESMKAI